MEDYMKVRDTLAVLENSTFCHFKINAYPVTIWQPKNKMFLSTVYEGGERTISSYKMKVLPGKSTMD
jgi:hypothetical protein